MKIDVIIPVYKPGRELFQLLENLSRQTVPVHKIILMNTEKEYFVRLVEEVCQENGLCLEDQYPDVEVHHLIKEEFDHGGTRHRAVGYSEAEIFVAMTQDAVPANAFLLERLVDALKDGVAVAYARQLPGADSSVLEQISREFNYPPQSVVKGAKDLDTLGIKTFFCSNVCAAYRREIYEELGGFIRHTIFNEDMIYAAKAVRAGYSVAYAAEAEVIHSHNYTNLQQLRRNFDLGVSQADHPEIFGGISSESEGKKLVAGTWKGLKERNCLRKFPGFCVQCGFKYAGYFLGKHYRKLPEKWVFAISTSKEYWSREYCDSKQGSRDSSSGSGADRN